MKDERQKAIRNIIEKKGTKTQREILDELQKMGIKTTQATISRDLDKLEVQKVAGGYAFPEEEPPEAARQLLKRVMADFVKNIAHSDNLVLIKTSAGGAQGVASILDDIRSNEILGTVAGDDTILVVTATKGSGKRVAQRLRKIMK